MLPAALNKRTISFAETTEDAINSLEIISQVQSDTDSIFSGQSHSSRSKTETPLLSTVTPNKRRNHYILWSVPETGKYPWAALSLQVKVQVTSLWTVILCSCETASIGLYFYSDSQGTIHPRFTVWEYESLQYKFVLAHRVLTAWSQHINWAGLSLVWYQNYCVIGS